MNDNQQNHRAALKEIAHQAMLEHGLLPEFSGEAMHEMAQLAAIPNIRSGQAVQAGDSFTVRDRRSQRWVSIDNDDSRDLDQLSSAQAMPNGVIKILVAIADVDSIIKKGSAIDEHARANTTSIYTAAEIFPMLPENVSTDLTSLNLNQDRVAVVIEMTVGLDGAIQDTAIFNAWVRNHAKLAYNSVAAWLEKSAEMPAELAAVPGLAEELLLQDVAAQRLKELRHAHGALSLETTQVRPIFDGDQIRTLEVDEKNRAKELIENIMIAANGVTARFLSKSGSPSIRRVVREPKRWDRIVHIAADHQFTLPETPDSKALEAFLVSQKKADPVRFSDLSLTIIKLLGAGEYLAELPEEQAPGHFGLAVKDYAHSTAPNRRYSDLLTQRLLKAALERKPAPYNKAELDTLAAHCTDAENSANKVERQVEKSAAALLLEGRCGEQFDAIVTGASEKGTWVRLISVPVEGKLVEGFQGLDVGQRMRVELVSVDVQKGFIDLKKINFSGH
jgi:exoribonuclease-2